MKRQVVLTKKAGFDVPMELISLILQKQPTAFGAVVQDQTGKEPELSIIHEATTPTPEQIKEFQRNAHDFNAMLYFGELGSKFNPEDIQPLIISDDNDQPFMALGLEGDFAKFAEPRSGRTDEFNFASEILIPSLLDICTVAGGDLEEIIAKIGEPRFNKNFLSHVAHRGSLTIFPLEGDPIWLAKNELGEVYDWGQTSQRYTFGDAKQEPEKAEEPAPVAAAPTKSKFSFGPAKAASPPPLPKSSVPDVPSSGPVPQPVKMPEWVNKNDDKRTWYSMVAGAIPDRWKNRVPVIPTIPVDKLPKDLGDLFAWKAQKLKASAAENKPVIQPVKTDTAAPAPAPTSGGEIAAEREGGNGQLINAKDMEKILDFAAKMLDTSGNDIPKLDDIQAIEKKLGEFSTSIASTPIETVNWPVSAVFALGRLDYRALALYAIEFRNLYRNTLSLKDLTGKSTTTVTDLGNGSTKVESVAKEEVKPAKKAGFSFKKTG